jgi:L-amino acid N-acyltransferase YncA
VTAPAVLVAIAPLQRTDWERWDAAHMPRHRLAATAGGRLVGWAALSPVSERCVYAGVVRLHEQAGFRVVGRRARLGRLHGAWRDVLLMERRSPVAG